MPNDLNHDEKVDVIIDALLDVDWCLAVEVKYTIKQVYPDPPERDTETKTYHLMSSDMHPFTCCGKDSSISEPKVDYYYTRDLTCMKYYSQMQCAVCHQAYRDNRHRIGK
jgi:hypothetical protein